MASPSLEEMAELVGKHARIEDEPMETAIWIRQQDPEAWLVEVLPDLTPDVYVDRPFSFNPGRAFRHPLNLIAGNREDIEQALRNNREFATWVAGGVVLHGADEGYRLQELARGVTGE